MSENLSLEQWLNSLEMAEYLPLFTEHHVTLADLPKFTSDDLKEVGITSLGHRKKLLEGVRLLGAGTAAAPEVSSGAIPAADFPETKSEPASPWLTPAAPGGNLFIPPIVEASPTAMAAAAPVYGAATPGFPVATTSAASTLAQPVAGVVATPPPRRGFWKRVLASKFLFYSVLAHLLFGVGATYFIVQSVQAKRKLTFQGGPPTTNPSKHALEHKVSMAQKKKTGGAPPQAKRIATTGLSKIALPEMPTMPTATTVAPGMAAGMGGAGLGTGMGFGNGAGNGMGGGGGGGGFSFFGFRGGTGTGGLIGTMYDLKQNRNNKPTKIGEEGPQTPLYTEEVKKIAKNAFHEGGLTGFYKASQALSATQFLIPNMNADEGPKAYGVEKEIQPGRWVAIYRGKVSPPKTATYRFVGAADDVMLARFGGRLVFDGSLLQSSDCAEDGVYRTTYGGNPARGGFVKGKTFRAEAGQWYDMDVLIGERPGGFFYVVLLIEEEGATYKKDGTGNPILPLFRTANAKLPPGTQLPPMTDPDGPLWKVQAPGTGSLLDALKR